MGGGDVVGSGVVGRSDGIDATDGTISDGEGDDKLVVIGTARPMTGSASIPTLVAGATD